MKLYFAGNVITSENETLLRSGGLVYRLMSFSDVDSWAKEAFKFWVERPAPAPLFLDSGAFGAFTRGQQIDIKYYCDFIKQYPDKFHPYASLDVIGDWRASAHNWDVMRGLGVNAMPTFHMNSPKTELIRLLKEADYIAMGGVVGATEETMKPWLDGCWRTIRDYWPKKLHIFGVMAQWALERYPWYSADSSSALVGAGMGRVTTFEESRVVSYAWADYGRKTYNGAVMDNVSDRKSKKGSAWQNRALFNVDSQLRLQEHVTDVWALRGITWPEEQIVNV